MAIHLLSEAYNLLAEIQELIYDTVLRQNDLCGPCASLKYGTLTDIEPEYVTVTWDETWRYGGYDSGTYELTAEMLDPATRDAALISKFCPKEKLHEC